MKIHIYTQDYENYAWDENGNLGVGADAYWKPKGGQDYFVPVPNMPLNDTAGAYLQSVVDIVRSKIEVDNEAFQSSIIGWQLVEDDYMTEFERSQLEYDGSITFRTEVISAQGVFLAPESVQLLAQ